MLAVEVAGLFSEGQGVEAGLIPLIEAPHADFRPTAASLDRVKRPGGASQALTAMRSMTGSTVMVGIFAGMVGQASLLDGNPILMIPIAAGLGSKAAADERKRQLAMRRSQAKVMVRKYADETSFNVAKESRDVLRRMNRDLREHFLRLADDLTATATAAHIRAREAVQATEASQKHRRSLVANLQQQLSTLDPAARPTDRTTQSAAAKSGT